MTTLGAPAGLQRGTCRYCQAPILWGVTPLKRKMPLNEGEQKVAMLGGVDGLTLVMVSGYIPHWATCPQRDQARQDADRRRGGEPT